MRPLDVVGQYLSTVYFVDHEAVDVLVDLAYARARVGRRALEFDFLGVYVKLTLELFTYPFDVVYVRLVERRNIVTVHGQLRKLVLYQAVELMLCILDFLFVA